MDEVEITNLDWRLFVSNVFPADSASATQTAKLLPVATALPVKDYYTSSFYDFYPVVGVSYAQVQLFCKWRSQIVTKEFRRLHNVHKEVDDFVCEFRLPTEAEWE